MSGNDERITSLLSEKRHFKPPSKGRERAWVGDIKSFEPACKKALEDPEGYWGACR